MLSENYGIIRCGNEFKICHFEKDEDFTFLFSDLILIANALKSFLIRDESFDSFGNKRIKIKIFKKSIVIYFENGSIELSGNEILNLYKFLAP